MSENDKPVLIYSTCPDQNVANDLARRVVESGLAACANIIPGMRSVYRWKGEIACDSEVVLIIKTRSSLSAAAIDTLVLHHPYETPAAVILPIEGGSEGYLAWLDAETADGES